MTDSTPATAARPCSCGRVRAECRTPDNPFLSCCTTCAANDGDTHGATTTAAHRWCGRSCRWRVHWFCADEGCDCTCHDEDDAKHALRWEEMADEC